MSKGGGVQVVLDETGSWAELNNTATNTHNKNATLPADAANGVALGKGGLGAAKPHGVLGFLSRKTGREKSPKPQEQGVLGKEGARVVINSGGR